MDEKLLADFDTFTAPEQPQAPIDPIEQHRPAEVDEDTWIDIKKRVSKFLGDYTPLGTIPKMVAGYAGEVMQKEGSQVKEALSVKSRLENIDFAYKDLADTVKSAVGDKEAEATLKTKQNKLNDEVVGILKDRGIEAYNDSGKLMVVTKDEKGEDVLNDLDENTLDNVLGGFKASAGEIAGGIIGAIGGAATAQRAMPLSATIPQRAVSGVAGGLIGGYTGSAAGRATDLIRNAISLNKEIDAKEVLQKSLEAGTADVAGAVVIGTVAKGASKAVEPLKKASQRLQTLFKEGNIEGAKRIVKEDYGLTDANIDTLYEAVKKDVKGAEELTGDDLLRAKLTAVIQQQPQGKAVITTAIRNNAKAAIETSKEIDFRAKQVLDSAEQFSKKPSAIKKSVDAYEKVVQKNYGEVRNLIDEALPNYKSDLDITSFSKTLDDVNTRVIDPMIKEKVQNLSESLAKQKTETVGDLINVRQLFNKFYGKNQGHFESKLDKDSLMSIQKTIDDKIDTAISTLPDEIAKGLKTAFADAKTKYAQMFKTQDTATYNAIFKKGASEDDIGKALVKYSKATDGDLEAVLSKLSPVQRTKSEFTILKQMVNAATVKNEAKAVDFTKLLEDIGTSKKIFKTPEAKQYLKNIESYDVKFGKDVDIQRIAAGVAPQVEKNIATGLAGKLWMKISALRFEALQRLMPTEQGRRLSLLKSVESALEKSRSPREFFFEASKIKGMPNQDRIALKKAIKEIGEKEALLKDEIALQATKNKESIAKAEALKEQQRVDKILTEQEFKKAKWEKAKAAAEKQKLSYQAQKAKDAAVVPIGGSEDEAKQAVKNVFAKNTSEEAKYKNMSKADIAEMERLDAEDLAREAETMFAKGAPELLGGTIAGVEQDEQGNITLDPAKFVMGVLGVSSIKGLSKAYKNSPKTQAKVEKALKSLASDSTRVAGEMLEKINKQIGLNIEPRIVADVKVAKKSKYHRGYGDSINHISTDKNNDVFIYSPYKNEKVAVLNTESKGQVAKLDYKIEDNKIIPLMVNTEEKQRRKGFASELYRAVSELEGKQIGEGIEITDDGLAFGKNIKESDVKGFLQKRIDQRKAIGLPEKGGREIYHPNRDKNYFYHPETDTIYFKRSSGQWKEMPNEQIKSDIKYIDKNGVIAFKKKNIIEDKQFEKAIEKNDIQKIESYKDQHTAPLRGTDGTTSIDDLTAIYPADIYNKDAARMYGHNDRHKDDIAMYILRKIKGDPEAKVTIYRAIPQNINSEINVGDWVTITKKYAEEHGDVRFNGKYKMLSKEVRARDIITDGNSIHEQGYDPK